MSLADLTSFQTGGGAGDKGSRMAGRMTHSLSTPAGVDNTSSTGHRGGKKLTVRVQMLDDSFTMFQVQAKALGKVLFEQVCRQLNLLEADYFGLEYQEMSSRTKYWLDLEKPLNRQVGFSLVDPFLRFCVKFYTPDPAQLEEEYTRYLFCLQIKRDLASGSLQCNENTAALMASYIVQASCGDFVPEDYPDHTYLSSYSFVPHQDDIMQRKIMENHKKHVGQSPAEADLNLLETARRCELYGMKMHSAKDVEGVPLNLAVAHMGITVFQNITRINTFSWAKIRKISFKRKRFLIKLHPEGYGYYKDTVEFYFDGRNECKNFWKKCVENHGFFRCIAVQNQPRRKSRVLSRGSSFRYSGKTQKQMIEFVRENYVKRQNFQRSQSFRQGPFSSSTRSQSHTYVNSSISANPLLPINTADWDYRNLHSDSMRSTAKRRGTDISDRQQNNPTDTTSTQVTAAQVENYAMKNCIPDSQNLEMANSSKIKLDQAGIYQDQQTSPTTQTNLCANAIENELHQNNQHFGLKHVSRAHNINTHRALAEYQVYAPVLHQPLIYSNLNNATTASLGDPSRYIRLEAEEETSSDLTTSTIRGENLATTMMSSQKILPTQESCSQTTSPIHYSSTKYSMPKRCVNNYSTETETDNVIYTDINVVSSNRHTNMTEISENENKIINRENINLNDNRDLYATINHKTKLKSRDKHSSDENINKKILHNLQARRRYLNDKHRNQESSNQSYDIFNNFIPTDVKYHNNLDHPSDSSSFFSFMTKYNSDITSEERLMNFDSFITSLDSQNSATSKAEYVPTKHSQSLPRKTEFCGVDSIDSYDSHYITHQSAVNMFGNGKRQIVNNACILSPFIETRRSSVPASAEMKQYSESMEDESSTNYIHPSYSEAFPNNIYDEVQREDPWLKSTSCKDLNDFSSIYFDIDIQNDNPQYVDKQFLSLNRIDSPITRYDEANQAYHIGKKQTQKKGTSLLFAATKQYSFSYPGSTFNTQDLQYKRRAGLHFENTMGSADDVSHDSYELLEKQTIHKICAERPRSEEHVSLDSGNYIQSEDEESLSEKHKYRSAMDVNCRSAADIMNEIWSSEDPRYLPREKMGVKSDGSFYKKIKDAISHGSSQESKKSHDSFYFSDSKKSRETTKSKSSVNSSQDLRETSQLIECLGRNYEMPTTTEKKLKQYKKEQFVLVHEESSSKSDFFYETAESSSGDQKNQYERSVVKSHDCLLTDSADNRASDSSFIYESRDIYLTFPSNKTSKTSKVHSISLQNVEMEKHTKSVGVKSPSSAPSFVKNNQQHKEIQANDSSIDKTISVEEYDLTYDSYPFRNRSEDSNIFSFEKQHIDDIQNFIEVDEKRRPSTEYPLTPELMSEFDKQQNRANSQKITRKEELIAKTHFDEYNPIISPAPYAHTTVERTKSDPNSLANRSRMGLNARRHVLMHQKSIDLTPVDSSDEDYIYKQIPSAPPMCKAHGNFEMPKCFEIPPKGVNDNKIERKPTGKEDIPYILHKRLILNGTSNASSKPKSPKQVKPTKTFKCTQSITDNFAKDIYANVMNVVMPTCSKDKILSQMLDESSLLPGDNETNEKSKQLDLSVLEKLNLKLSQIESDSATSSHTESLQQRRKLEHRDIELVHCLRKELQMNSKKLPKPRVIAKPKITKPKKSKTRITSFSSDDESIDSDDVFGSAEAISHRKEFSPPQSRKEIEPILKIEQNRLISASWGRGQTMSSTEIEGSPPQCRRLAELESRYNPPKLDTTGLSSTELRRISERSISIPSSEDEHNMPLRSNEVCTNDYQLAENIPSPILEVSEFFRSNDDIYESYFSKNLTEIDYTLIKNQLPSTDNRSVKAKQIEEILDTSIIKRSKGHAPILFAHARLNLSEGSVIVENQGSAETLNNDKRTKSLDAPVISLHKLPPMDAFSSKDDTVSFEEEAEILEEKTLVTKTNNETHEDDTAESIQSCAGSIPSQLYQTADSGGNEIIIKNSACIDEQENALLDQLALIEKITLQSVKVKHTKKSKLRLKSGNDLILNIPKYNFAEWTPCTSATSSRKTSPGVSRANSSENTTDLLKPKTLNLRGRQDVRRSSADERHDNRKKPVVKNRARSSENRKTGDKSKSHVETEAEIKARKERQQKLYETAIKQTINMLSPVKDTLPSFPGPTDKISVSTEGDNIIIDTEFAAKVQDQVFIAQSPKKLDASLIKFSRSFEERRSPDKLDKVNRSFEDRNKSFEDSEKTATTNESVDKDKQNVKQQIEGAVVCTKKTTDKSKSLEKQSEPHLSLNKEKKTKSLDEKRSKTTVRSSIGDRRMFANQFQTQEDIDMQAVISERRSLEIYKRSLPSEENKDYECSLSRKPSTTESIDSYVSVDNSHSPLSKSPVPYESYPHRVPTIECEEPSIEEDNSAEIQHLKVARTDITRLSLDRSRSDETGSWMTVECDEFVGSDTSDNEQRTLEPERCVLEQQATLEDAIPLEYSNCATPTSDLGRAGTSPIISPIVEKVVVEMFQALREQKDLNFEKGESTKHSPEMCLLTSLSKEKSSLDEESSVSCSIARPLGISQDFGDIDKKKCLEIKKKVFKIELKSEQDALDPKPAKKSTTPVLEKQSQIDIEIGSEILLETGENIRVQVEKVATAKSQQHVSNLKIELTKSSERGSQESKSSVDSKKSSSIDSKGSFETESSSGSGVGAQKVTGEVQFKSQKQIPFRPLTLENSSSNTDESWNNMDYTTDAEHEHDDSQLVLPIIMSNEPRELAMDPQKSSDTCTDELLDFPTTSIGYPALTCGIGVNQSDIIGFNSTFTVGRTLSRISERSTASEKSSMEDDISKASTHSASLRDESVALTDHHQSLSSDSRSNTNLAYISEADRRTSAEMPEIPCDSATGDKLSSTGSGDPRSPTVVKGRFSITQINEGENIEDRQSIMCLSNTGSQDSEDWPLPEIPFDHVPVKPVECLYASPDYEKTMTKTLSWKHQDNFEKRNTQDSDNELQEEASNRSYTENTEIIILKALEVPLRAELCYEPDSSFEEYPSDFAEVEDDSKDEYMPGTSTCLKSSSFSPSVCLSTSYNASCSNLKRAKDRYLKKDLSFDSVIVAQPTRSPSIKSPTSDNEGFSGDEVFMPGTIKVQFPAHAQCLNISSDEIQMDEPKIALPAFPAAPCRKCSYSSHSEEETSSLGTDIEGTVRMGLQQKKCTHSSHSEDTSIGLSISEWSTGTNTVKQYANLSGSDSLSAISGIKSEKSHQTKSSMSSINKSIESLNDQSGSFSNKFSFDNGSSEAFRYDILSNSETDKASDTNTSATKSDDTTHTLTDMVHSLSEWSTSSSRTIVGQQNKETYGNEKEQRSNTRRDKNEYDDQCRQTLSLVKNYYLEDKKQALPAVHKPLDYNKFVTGSDVSRRRKLLHTESFDLEKITSEKSDNDRQVQKELGQSQSNFLERLYSPSEKLSERYQSQDFTAMKAKIERQQFTEQLSDLKNQKVRSRPYGLAQETIHEKPTTSKTTMLTENVKASEIVAIHETSAPTSTSNTDKHPVKPQRTKKRLKAPVPPPPDVEVTKPNE